MIRHAMCLLPIVLAAAPANAQQKAAPIVTVAAANRNATQQPVSQAFVNGSQIYAFADGMIFQGYTAPGAITDIALQPGEALVALASGDTARWMIGDTTSGSGEAKRTHILVKPFAAGLATNLVITTHRRAYHVRLTSTTRTAMSSIRWTYAQDDLIAFRLQADAAEPVASGLSVERLQFDYGITGDKPAWRPLQAFDDGRQTYIEFPASLAQGDAPPLFVIGTNGKAELVNYRLRDRYYIVDRLFDAAELRLGAKKHKLSALRVEPSQSIGGAHDRAR